MTRLLRKGFLNAEAAARTPRYGKGIVGLWKQGWNEIPEVMGSAFYGVLGLFGCYYFGYYRYFKEERYNHRFKATYLIYRPDDERVERLRRLEDSPQPTTTPAGFKRESC